MASIFLSPSLQEYNPCVTGGNEEERMNLLASALTPYLDAMGITYGRSDPEFTLSQAIEASNAGDYDLHLALHSNAAPEELKGILRGPDVYYYIESEEGKKAAELLGERFRQVYPYPQDVGVLSTASLRELKNTDAPSVLIETAYHDNVEDDTWLRENIWVIARAIALGISDYVGVPFVEI
ncbi:MAG: N-acetylmuramoyl-L-alanine amidase [Lachnospiraceae bacterium]|nr:N-acetylmuramoyl-L-alanine amidase [Lachnospiraceae bacterium]